MRFREYIPREDDKRFAQHERFILEEVLPYAGEQFGAPRDREDRIVYGFSNGGVFAAAMGLRNPDIFGYLLPFSAGVNPTDVTKLREVDTDFYFVAGTLEERFFETTKTLAEQLARAGIESQFTARVAGHDFHDVGRAISKGAAMGV